MRTILRIVPALILAAAGCGSGEAVRDSPNEALGFATDVQWIKPPTGYTGSVSGVAEVVFVDVCIEGDGTISQTHLNTSSGDHRLDQAALSAAEKYKDWPRWGRSPSDRQWKVVKYVFPSFGWESDPCAGGDRGPEVISTVSPVYSHEAYSAGIEGIMIVKVVVSKSGKVSESRVLRSPHPSLDQAALDAVRQYRFAPGVKDCAPIDMELLVPITFRLK